MATVVGVESTAGVVLAGDRRLVDGGRVRSTAKRHVHGWGDVATAVVGDAGAIEQFVRAFESDLDTYRLERGDPDVDTVTSVARRLATETGVGVLVAARDGDGDARLRTVDSTGGVTCDDRAALGTGAALALGNLEAAEASDLSALDAVERRTRAALAATTERDAGTGETVDVWRLTHE